MDGLGGLPKLIEERFKSTFQSSCSKYSFVHRYWDNLENPPKQGVEFVFNEAQVDPGSFGGLGDRLAGLATATAIALRFNRTLFLNAADRINDDIVNKYFRPYPNPAHSFGFHNSRNNSQIKSILTYSNLRRRFFSYYHRSERTNQQNRKYSQLELKHCINPEFKSIFTFNRSDINDCGLDNRMYVDEDIIRLKSNRCYLCKWMDNEQSVAYNQLRDLLGLTEKDNLFEVSGCLLRLALWPTNLAFEMMAKNLLSSSFSANSSHYSPSSPLLHRLPFTIGMHFRCGDMYMSTNSTQCEHVPDRASSMETERMREGTPIDIGSCANQVANDFYSSRNPAEINVNETMMPSQLMLHVASDNMMSLDQMLQYAISATGDYKKPLLQESTTIFAPPIGCHIDYNSSLGCQESTIVSWLLLSLSDAMVLPMADGTTASAFSRYAAIYGLTTVSNNRLYDPITCSAFDTNSMSKAEQGNWMCSNELFLQQQQKQVTAWLQKKSSLRWQERFRLQQWPDSLATGMVIQEMVLIGLFVITLGLLVYYRCQRKNALPSRGSQQSLSSLGLASSTLPSRGSQQSLSSLGLPSSTLPSRGSQQSLSLSGLASRMSQEFSIVNNNK